jgi:hypothetical protein
MRLLMAGLSTREEAALGFFLDRSFKSWTWQSVAPDVQAPRPPADVLVLDMAAFGWAHWSEAAEAQLLAWLQGTPAVLLISTHDRSWSVLQERPASASRVWLGKPYGTQTMREALDQAATAVRTAPAVPAAPKVVRPVAVESAPAPVQARPAPTLAKAEPAKVAPPKAEPASEPPGLTAAGFQARLTSLPDQTPHAFLQVLSEMLSQPDAFEARFTVQNSLIIHPANGWFATNTPLQVIYRLCESDAMASAVTVRTLDDAQAEERAQRLGMPPQDLDVFLWNLVAATLDKRAAAPLR